MKTKIIISVVVVLLIALAIGFYFYKNPINNTPSTSQVSSGVDDLKNSLLSQSKLEKFSTPQEIKNFFAKLSPNNTSSGLALDRATTLATPSATKMSANTEASGLGGGGNNFSTTNVQVPGVDESDITKTDGKFIYIISDRAVQIVSAVPATDASLVATIKLNGQAQELYLKDNRLAVFGYDDVPVSASGFIRPYNYVFLNFYDITDPKNPELIKDFKFEGSYSASRLIDNRLYFITTTYNFYPYNDFVLPKVMLKDQTISSETTTAQYVYPQVFYIKSPDSYNATTVSLISLDKLDEPLKSQVYFMPSSESVYASTENLYLTYTKYISDYQLRMAVAKDLVFDRLSASQRERIASINAVDSSILSDDEKANKINQVIDAYFASLANAERETLFKQLDEEFNQRYQAVYKELEKTVIHKIKLNNDQLDYVGTGEVSGHVLNQYSMDENNNYFRIATTRGQSWIMPFMSEFRPMIAPATPVQESYNNLYILDSNLKVVGSNEDFAKGEKIYSVRFINDRGYVVTFKQTDPLFVFDLSAPTNPVMAGQLKIPGFSSYLHPYGENMLIGIGKEAIDNGAQGVTVNGLKISLFDVTDPANPKEAASLKLGGQGSDTSVLYDYKAFLLIPDKNSMVIPMSLTKPGSNNYTQEFQGAVVFSLSKDKITELGRVFHTVKDPNLNYQKQIQRSLFIGDYLYTKSMAAIGINKLDNLSFIKQIDLPSTAQVTGGNSGSGGVPVPLTIENVKIK